MDIHIGIVCLRNGLTSGNIDGFVVLMTLIYRFVFNKSTQTKKKVLHEGILSSTIGILKAKQQFIFAFSVIK